MKKMIVLFFCLSLFSSSLLASELSRDELMRAKQLYRHWKQTGIATSQEKQLISEYRHHFDQARDDNSNDPLDFSAGPDAFGYRWSDNIAGDTATYSWIDLCGDITAIDGPQGDDVFSLVPLSFQFPFYGVNYDTMWISSNGLIDFDGPNTDYDNLCPFASGNALSSVIAVHWDDMIADLVGGCNGNANPPWIRYKNFGTYVVVEWKRLHYIDDQGDRYWFEAILYSDGKIKLQYRQINAATGRNTATVGIDAPGDNLGLEYNCNTAGNYFQNNNSINRAVWFFRRQQQATDIGVYSVQSPYGNQPGSFSVTVIANVTNIGTNNVSTASVSYKFNRTGTVHSEPLSVLTSGQVETHVFATPFTTPVNQHDDTLFVWTSLVGDQDRSNDTLKMAVHTRPCADYVVTAPYLSPHRSSCSGDDCDLNGNQTQEDIYQVTIPRTGQWTFTLCDPTTTYDSYLVLSDACCGNIIDENDDTDYDCEDILLSEIHCIDLQAGTYFLQIEGFDDCGGYVLRIDSCFVPPPVPCDSAIGITAIRIGLTDSVKIDFTAPQAGGYTLWKTSVKTNDGDPRNGDPDWTIVTTLFFNLGANSFIDPISVNYANYVITQECVGAIHSRNSAR